MECQTLALTVMFAQLTMSVIKVCFSTEKSRGKTTMEFAGVLAIMSIGENVRFL